MSDCTELQGARSATECGGCGERLVRCGRQLVFCRECQRIQNLGSVKDNRPDKSSFASMVFDTKALTNAGTTALSMSFAAGNCPHQIRHDHKFHRSETYKTNPA
jgi:hypothetical protein